MMVVQQIRPLRLLQLAAFLAYGFILLGAVNADVLSSLASDSVHYLLMARHLSPWGASDPIAAAAFAEQDYPPLFGLVLGLAGAGRDLATAHLVNGGLLLGALLLLRQYALAVTGSEGIAFAVAAIFAISPGAWMNSLDVLSENLYLLLSLAILLRGGRNETSPRALVITGVMVAALVLTRTVGLAMLVAIAALGAVRGTGTRGKIAAAGTPVAITIGLLLLVQIAVATGVPDQYVHGFDRIAGGQSPHGRIETGAYLLSQLAALYDAWLGNWLWYWNSATVFNTACLSVAGLLGLAAGWRSLRAGRVDALYLGVYVAVIVAWPHPGQMTRFVYPIAPLLLALGLKELRCLAEWLPAKWRPVPVPLFAALVGFSVLPSLLYTWQRHEAGAASGLEHMTEFYRLPDLRAAGLEASVHAQMADDLARIGTLLPPGAAVLYTEPAYVALLAGRRGIRLPHEADAGAVRAIADAAATPWLLLTRFNPRRWRAGEDRFAGSEDPATFGDVAYASTSAIDGRRVSVLIRLPDAR